MVELRAIRSKLGQNALPDHVVDRAEHEVLRVEVTVQHANQRGFVAFVSVPCRVGPGTTRGLRTASSTATRSDWTSLEALKEVRAKRHATADHLWRYAKLCRMANVMRPYLEAVE